jgi:hypothetical protein
MSEPIGPTDPISRARRIARRRLAAEPDHEPAGDAAPKPPARIHAPADEPAPPTRGAAAAFAAQVMGQGGQKRGLRGGPETLDRARATYLETEWSGGADRRIPRGKIAKTEI